MRKDSNIWQEIFRGIEDGKRAFHGPHTVQIDLTDKCNNTCIGCWVHSPLLDKKEVFPQGEKELPFSLVRKLITQLDQMGTKEIILSGSGEPFMYPAIIKAIKLIKSKGIYLNIITNGSLLNKRVSQFLVDAGVDLITVSIWAGTAKAYVATHPGKSAKDFEYLKDNLKNLASYKQYRSSLLPHLKIYNVVCSSNYYDTEAAVDYAAEVDADSIEFQIIDIIYGKTDSLSLTEGDSEKIVGQLERVRERNDLVPFNAPPQTALDKFTNEEFLDFGKIWKNYRDKFYVSQYSNSLICKEGCDITNERIIVSESTSTKDTRPAVFWYKFKSKVCKDCAERDNCLDEKMAINVKLLNILGIGSFLRRLFYSDLEKGVYEKQINTIPCYMGWHYARILTDGSVVPCCKAAEFPLGNLYKADFRKIWHSSLYEEFRFNAKNLPKSNKYFSKLNCIKSCDNWGMNLEIEKTIRET